MATVLCEAGYEAVPTASGEEALREIRGIARPLLLVADVNLGGMDGLALAGAVRSAHPAAAALLMGGRLPDPDPPPFLEFLRKPFGTRQLLARVAAIAARVEAPRPVLH